MEEFRICPVSNYYQRILLPLCYSLVFLLGLTLNGALLWCVCVSGARRRGRGRRCHRSSTAVYLTNLAVADLLYVLALPPLIVSNAMGGQWPFGDATCKAVRFFFFVNLHGSMLFLTCVSAHRFVGVRFPLAAVRLRARRTAVCAAGTVWVLAVAEILPTLTFAHTGVIDNVTVCFEMTDPEQFKVYFPYGLFLTIVGFLVPFLVVVTCYFSIIRVLCCRVSTARMRNKSLCTLLLVCAIFVVCFVPYHIMRTAYLFVRVYTGADCRLLNAVMISFKVWKPVVSFNCCANPLLFFLGSGRQRRRLWAWTRSRTRSRVQPSPPEA